MGRIRKEAEYDYLYLDSICRTGPSTGRSLAQISWPGLARHSIAHLRGVAIVAGLKIAITRQPHIRLKILLDSGGIGGVCQYHRFASGSGLRRRLAWRCTYKRSRHDLGCYDRLEMI